MLFNSVIYFHSYCMMWFIFLIEQLLTYEI